MTTAADLDARLSLKQVIASLKDRSSYRNIRDLQVLFPGATRSLTGAPSERPTLRVALITARFFSVYLAKTLARTVSRDLGRSATHLPFPAISRSRATIPWPAVTFRIIIRYYSGTMKHPAQPMKRIKIKLIRGGVWATTGKGLLGLVTLAINALLTRLLPPEEIGIYFLLFSLVSVLALAAQAGMHLTLVKLVAEVRSTGSTHSAISTIRSAYLLVAAATLLVCATFAGGAGAWISSRFFHFTLPNEVVYMAAAWIAAFTFRSLIAQTFRGLHDIKHASLFEGLLDGLVFFSLLGVLYILHTHGDLSQVILLAIAASYLNIFVASIILRKKLKAKLHTTEGYEKPLEIRQLLSTAWPLWVTSITLFVLAQTDLWIMGILREQSEVGVYGVVRRLAVLVSMSLMIVNSVVPPLIAEMNANKEHDKLERALRATSTVAALPSFFALALFIFGAEPMLRIIYGEYYTTGASILVTLSLGQLVNVWCGSCGYVLMMTGHQVAIMKISILCGVISITLAFYLIPIFGGAGAAASVSTALILQNLLMLFAVRRYLGIWTQIDIRLLWRQLSGPH